MSILTGNTIHIDNFPMQIATVTLTKVGDSITETLEQRGISKDTYISRHILATGWINIECMVDGEIVGPYLTESPYILKMRHGVIVYPNDAADVTGWKTTATEDNTSFYCIYPKTQRKLVNNSENLLVRDKIWRIPSGQSFRFKTGRYYISNVDLNINGIIKPALEPIACVYREADAIPAVDAAIAEFWVETVFISK